MTTQPHRIQDPVLTQLAQGYHNNALICESLFPVVEMDKEGGKIPKFGRLAFRQHSTVRQLHGDSNRLTPEDIGVINVELDEHDIEYPIDYREQNDASYPLKQYALSVVQDVIALGRELETAKLAQNPDSYETSNKAILSGSSQFTHEQSDPLKTIYKGVETIKHSIGLAPNVCVISADVWAVLKEHKQLIERIKYTQAGILTEDILAKLIGVEQVKIGEAVQEVEGQLVKIWQDCIILAYVPQRTNQKKGTIFEPSYGYTVRRKNGLFVDTYQEKGGKVEIVRCTDIHKPCLVGSSAGYLIKNCIAK